MLENKSTGTLNVYCNVTLSKLTNGKKIEKHSYHNSVTTTLFKGIGAFLQNFITSVSSHSDYIPRYLGVGIGKITQPFSVNSNSLYSELNIPRFQLVNNISSLSTNEILTIPYQTIIPYSSISSNEITNIGLFGREFVDNSSTNQLLLAGVDVTETIYTQADPQPKNKTEIDKGDYYIVNIDGTYSKATEFTEGVTYYVKQIKGITLSPGDTYIVDWEINLQSGNGGVING